MPGDQQERMDSCVCKTGDCLGEIQLIPLVAAVFNGMMGRLLRTCLLWVFSPFLGCMSSFKAAGSN